jgi:hypothetical protein
MRGEKSQKGLTGRPRLLLRKVGGAKLTENYEYEFLPLETVGF